MTQPGNTHFQYFVRMTYTMHAGFVQVLKGEGMPSFGNRDVRGDLYVEYTVVLPIDISSDLRQSRLLLFASRLQSLIPLQKLEMPSRFLPQAHGTNFDM